MNWSVADVLQRGTYVNLRRFAEFLGLRPAASKAALIVQIRGKLR